MSSLSEKQQKSIEKEARKLQNKLNNSKRLSLYSDFDQEQVEEEVEPITNLRFTNILYLSPDTIKVTKKNEDYFKRPTEKEYLKLKKDIEKYGIQTPLFVDNQYVVLCGHTRYSISKELQINKLPVIMISTDLTESQTESFIKRDNLLRRHLSDDEKSTIYRSLPQEDRLVIIQETFSEEEILQENRGGDRKSNRNEFPFDPDSPKSSKNKPVSQQIVEEFGISEKIARQDLKLLRDRKQPKPETQITDKRYLDYQSKSEVLNQKLEELNNEEKERIQLIKDQYQIKKNRLRTQIKDIQKKMKRRRDDLS